MTKTQLVKFNSIISQEEGGREGRELGMGRRSKNAISITAMYFGSIEARACMCTHTWFIVKLKCPIIWVILFMKSHL